MAARKIRLQQAFFRSCKLTVKAEVISIAGVTAQFDHVVADQLGVKEHIFAGGEAEPRAYELETELYGARVTVRPQQARTDGKITIGGDGVQFTTLCVDNFRIRKEKTHETLNVSFDFSLIDDSHELHDLIYALKKDQFDCIIEPASKKDAETAQQQLKLVGGKPKQEEDEEESGESDARVVQ